MPTVTTSSGDIFFIQHEATLQPPPVLLIHGASSNHLAWSAELRRIPNRRVVALDLPAHGRSIGQASEDLNHYTTAVIDLLNALKIRRVIPVGHSMGGAIAQLLALNYPNRCSGLVLLSTSPKLTVNEWILKTVKVNPAEVVEKVHEWSWSKNTPQEIRNLSKRVMLAFPPEVMYADYAACNNFDVTHRLHEIACPTLVIGGTEDKMTPFSNSQALAANIPNATLKTFEGGAHWVMLEQAAQVANDVFAWLTEQGL